MSIIGLVVSFPARFILFSFSTDVSSLSSTKALKVDICVEAESSADAAQLPSLTTQMQVVNGTCISADVFSVA